MQAVRKSTQIDKWSAAGCQVIAANDDWHDCSWKFVIKAKDHLG